MINPDVYDFLVVLRDFFLVVFLRVDFAEDLEAFLLVAV